MRESAAKAMGSFGSATGQADAAPAAPAARPSGRRGLPGGAMFGSADEEPAVPEPERKLSFAEMMDAALEIERGDEEPIAEAEEELPPVEPW